MSKKLSPAIKKAVPIGTTKKKTCAICFERIFRENFPGKSPGTVFSQKKFNSTYPLSLQLKRKTHWSLKKLLIALSKIPGRISRENFPRQCPTKKIQESTILSCNITCINCEKKWSMEKLFFFACEKQRTLYKRSKIGDFLQMSPPKINSWCPRNDRKKQVMSRN